MPSMSAATNELTPGTVWMPLSTRKMKFLKCFKAAREKSAARQLRISEFSRGAWSLFRLYLMCRVRSDSLVEDRRKLTVYCQSIKNIVIAVVIDVTAFRRLANGELHFSSSDSIWHISFIIMATKVPSKANRVINFCNQSILRSSERSWKSSPASRARSLSDSFCFAAETLSLGLTTFSSSWCDWGFSMEPFSPSLPFKKVRTTKLGVFVADAKCGTLILADPFSTAQGHLLDDGVTGGWLGLG
mmetsp:Transcript_72949/g.194717  ORF Transcript_72949/g.194717 Transcript_72949/m.194717 type:complete len:244 (-) Transcript_72949:8-739(-)